MDHKSGKRRNSFGSTKSDNADQEPRDSSSHNPLPSYMQATESARAKAHSPRSSRDVHDKEVQIKKRHSLPGASGRQGSPHIRSASQVAQGAKTNGYGGARMSLIVHPVLRPSFKAQWRENVTHCRDMLHENSTLTSMFEKVARTSVVSSDVENPVARAPVRGNGKGKEVLYGVI
ncbi:hypothetical protein Cgig2_025714 [Carnegiea gigantea]|uniref:DUF4005 domain-containing protein n=1 Tax=Carnegiea gigantea TaxID=171969 RepID=A0A9Q1JR98_9CARY|nr:hypothetical protein Cgig2_025714 [Carnegiea gigantea]